MEQPIVGVLQPLLCNVQSVILLLLLLVQRSLLMM
jgi:hypothetical protein